MIAAGYGRGLVQLFHGNFDDAENTLRSAASLSRENEVSLFLPLIQCGLGNLYLQTGRPRDARDILVKAKSEAEAIGHTTSDMLASVYLASAYAYLGDTARGLSLAGACHASARQKGYEGVDAIALFVEAGILSIQRETADAIAHFERAIELAARLEVRPLMGIAKGMLARLLATAGKPAEARAELNQAIALFAQSKMTAQLERARAALSKFSNL